MVVLGVVGLMSLPAMGVLSLLVLAEKNRRHGLVLARVAGAGMVALGALVRVL